MSIEYKENAIERIYAILGIKNKTKYEINSREIWTGYMNFLYKMTTFELEFLEDKLKTLFKDKHQELNLNEDNDESEQ